MKKKKKIRGNRNKSTYTATHISNFTIETI